MLHAYESMARIQDAPSRDAVTKIAGDYFAELGFEKFAYVILDTPHDPGMNKTYLSNYPLEWQKRYTANDYFRVDPIFTIARRRKKSFIWGSDEAIIPETEEQKKFFQESGDIGTSQGLSVPILLPKGGFGLLSLCSQTLNQKAMDGYLKHIESDLTTAALLLHQGMMLWREQLPMMRDYQLSQLEHETLYWLCQNKTYNDIAEILGMGREGVSERLRKVYRKMNAVGKVDAVKKAIQSGLFEL